MSQLSAVNPDIRTRCSEILSGLTVVERRALKAISNDEPVEASFYLLGKFKRLGLIEHNWPKGLVDTGSKAFLRP